MSSQILPGFWTHLLMELLSESDHEAFSVLPQSLRLSPSPSLADEPSPVEAELVPSVPRDREAMEGDWAYLEPKHLQILGECPAKTKLRKFFEHYACDVQICSMATPWFALEKNMLKWLEFTKHVIFSTVLTRCRPVTQATKHRTCRRPSSCWWWWTCDIHLLIT